MSVCLSNYLTFTDPLKKPAITLSLSSLSSSPPILAISALLGILYLVALAPHSRSFLVPPRPPFTLDHHLLGLGGIIGVLKLVRKYRGDILSSGSFLELNKSGSSDLITQRY